MNAPGLSVIIPNFNRARYLSRCLDAMLGQSVQAGEILVIDDASDDDSVSIIETNVRRFSHLRLIHDARNRGVIPTINLGLLIAAHGYFISERRTISLCPASSRNP